MCCINRANLHEFKDQRKFLPDKSKKKTASQYIRTFLNSCRGAGFQTIMRIWWTVVYQIFNIHASSPSASDFFNKAKTMNILKWDCHLNVLNFKKNLYSQNWIHLVKISLELSAFLNRQFFHIMPGSVLTRWLWMEAHFFSTEMFQLEKSQSLSSRRTMMQFNWSIPNIRTCDFKPKNISKKI